MSLSVNVPQKGDLGMCFFTYVLQKCELGDPAIFLSSAVDPPSPQSVSRALSILREVGACHPSTPSLTPLGHHLAALPVDVRLGKMLVYSAVLGCLQPMVSMPYFKAMVSLHY